mgnify:CR=1 FL=1
MAARLDTLPRDSCTCRRERLVGKLVQGWTMPPPCPACAAWEEGFILVDGQKLYRRQDWIALQERALTER